MLFILALLLEYFVVDFNINDFYFDECFYFKELYRFADYDLYFDFLSENIIAL